MLGADGVQLAAPMRCATNESKKTCVFMIREFTAISFSFGLLRYTASSLLGWGRYRQVKLTVHAI